MGHTLHVVIDRTPPPVRKLLLAACEARGVAYQEVKAAAWDPSAPPLAPGDLLYAPAASVQASRVERQLFQPGVATLHADDAFGPYRIVLDQAGLFPRVGLPTPRAVDVRATDRDALDALAHDLGGFPVILKAGGGEGGVGVMRLNDLDTLQAVSQSLRAHGASLTMMTWIPDAMHWRLIVVGGRVVSAYLNPLGPDGVRSVPSDDPADYGLTPPDALAELAVEATRTNGTDMAGVDVLAHPSGRAYVLEANFPCYFPTAQTHEGTPDVAGAMVDFLLAKAARLSGA